MILVEAQTTWTENIIVRCIMYLAQTWKDYFIITRQSVYDSTKLDFPEPELYVLYTGSKKSIKLPFLFLKNFLTEKKFLLMQKSKFLQMVRIIT